MSNARIDLTEVANLAGAGDSQAREDLMRIVATELHRLAAFYVRGERQDHLLQPTALVNEMYLKLFHSGARLKVNSRSHFFALAARQMRCILVDYARGEGAGKRKGIRVEFDELFHGTGDPDRNLIALDDALDELSRVDPDAAKAIELRFFGGYTLDETAAIMEENVAKIRRDWEFARSWLYDRTAKM